jgi:hypothetical protein
VVFPKVLEGVTIGVIRSHLAKVSTYLSKKEQEERKRKEYEQMQMRYPDGKPDEFEPYETVDSDDGLDDDSDEDDTEEEDDGSDTDDEGDGLVIDFEQVARDAEAALSAEGVEVTVHRRAGE